MKYFQSVCIVLVCLAAFSCGKKSGGKDDKDKQPPLVDVIIAEEQDLPNTIEVNGSVLSQEMVELHPEISGRIIYLDIPDGAKVTQGTILARINDADLEAELDQLNVQLDIAKKTEQRMKQLLAVNGVDQASYDAALSARDNLEASINVKKAEIDKTVIRAPFTGTLGLRQVSPGAYVTPSTLIGTLQETDEVKIDFTLPETYASMVSKGSKIGVVTNHSTDTIAATVIAIEPQVNVATRNLKVRARPEKSGSILPGSFAKVLLEQNGRGIVVPTNAIIPDALSNQVVIVKGGKSVFVNVETGIRTEKVIQLTKGISPGDSIIVSGVLFVRPDGKVKVRKVKN